MNKEMRNGKWQNGFTLLEALVVIGLLAVVVAITIPPFFRIIQKYRAETAIDQVTMNLRFARLAALKKRIPYRVVFSADPTNTYEVQVNPSRDLVTWEKYARSDTSIPGGLTILSGGITNVTYSPRGSANISGGSAIRIQSTDYIYRINVYTTGAVTKTAE